MRMKSLCCIALMFFAISLSAQKNEKAPEGFVSLFNTRDLTGWKIPEKITAIGKLWKALSTMMHPAKRKKIKTCGQ
jgi:hypothetical protein